MDLFHHDSLHTYEHMTWEYELAARHLSRDGVLSSHDVLVADGLRGVFRENAFPVFCRNLRLPNFIVRNLGVALAAPAWEVHTAGAPSGEMGERHTSVPD